MKIKVHDLKEEVKEKQEEDWVGLFIYTNDEGDKTIVLGVGSEERSSFFKGVEIYSDVAPKWIFNDLWRKSLYVRYNKPLTVTFEND